VIWALLAAEQALLDQGVDAVERIEGDAARGLTDCLCGLEGAASAEDRQPGEQGAFGRGQQIVAPGDGGAQGLLALGEVAGAAGKDRKSLVEARQ
jgi:hypothetical protein